LGDSKQLDEIDSHHPSIAIPIEFQSALQKPISKFPEKDSPVEYKISASVHPAKKMEQTSNGLSFQYPNTR
ncbi:hypothetical protein N9066_01535, partial [bacterium]|nr:hypothetical protein [bacterium]